MGHYHQLSGWVLDLIKRGRLGGGLMTEEEDGDVSTEAGGEKMTWREEGS